MEKVTRPHLTGLIHEVTPPLPDGALLEVHKMLFERVREMHLMWSNPYVPCKKLINVIAFTAH